MIRIARLVATQPGVAFPAWKGMQYMRDQFSGRARLTQLDNRRYPGTRWTAIRDHVSTLEG